jgi:hypothetical protein
VPAHTLGRLLRLRDPDADRWARNMAMHYASGAIGGALRDELAIDVSHKALYSFVTGLVSDALVPPSPRSSARRRALGRRLKGHA